MIIRAIIEWDEEAQVYCATCPELNFVSSFGDTKTEAIEYLKDAINLMLEPITNDLIAAKSQAEIVELSL
jgi:predicted RNase H-like HicB family nuclease